MHIVMVCGCPGCGKTTWIKSYMEDHPEEQCIHISRDEIRFGMVSENEEYFSKEDAVFEEFIRQIQEAIDNETEVIFVDATHISWRSRDKVLSQLDLKEYQLKYVKFDITAATCIKRNNKRKGRARVPESVIRRMYWQSDNEFKDYGKYPHTVCVIKEWL